MPPQLTHVHTAAVVKGPELASGGDVFGPSLVCSKRSDGFMV